jgi:hypothetical protein
MALGALEALHREVSAIPGARITVVDNDSQDGSFELLRDAVVARTWQGVVEVLQSGHNGGYGFGNNVALRRALHAAEKPELLYLLNSDATPDPGCLTRLVHYMDEHPRVGIAGSLLHFPDGEEQQSVFRFPSLLSETDRALRLGMVTSLLSEHILPMPLPAANSDDVDWVAGASMVLRRSTLEQIGLFDEEFFLYFEETDLCLRAQRAGWKVAFVREASAAHVAGASTGVATHRVSLARMPQYWFDSRRHYFLKNHGRRVLWAANAIDAVGGATFRLRRRVQGKPDPDRPRQWLDGVLYNLRHP